MALVPPFNSTEEEPTESPQLECVGVGTLVQCRANIRNWADGPYKGVGPSAKLTFASVPSCRVGVREGDRRRRVRGVHSKYRS